MVRRAAERRCAARCLPVRPRRRAMGLSCIRSRRLSGRAQEGGRAVSICGRVRRGRSARGSAALAPAAGPAWLAPAAAAIAASARDPVTVLAVPGPASRLTGSGSSCNRRPWWSESRIRVQIMPWHRSSHIRPQVKAPQAWIARPFTKRLLCLLSYVGGRLCRAADPLPSRGNESLTCGVSHYRACPGMPGRILRYPAGAGRQLPGVRGSGGSAPAVACCRVSGAWPVCGYLGWG